MATTGLVFSMLLLKLKANNPEAQNSTTVEGTGCGPPVHLREIFSNSDEEPNSDKSDEAETLRLEMELASKIREIKETIEENDQLRMYSQTKNTELQLVLKAYHSDREEYKAVIQKLMNSSDKMKAKIIEAYEIKREMILVQRENSDLKETSNEQIMNAQKSDEKIRKLEEIYQDLVSKFENEMMLSQNLQAQLQEKDQQIPKLENETEELKLDVMNLENENVKLKKTLQSKETLMEPFKVQLEAYRIEMLLEKEGKMANEAKCKEIFGKYAELVGHQNKKQKIQHLIKLKEDNWKAWKEVEILRHELAQSKKAVARLERERSFPQNTRFESKVALKPGDEFEKENNILQPLLQQEFSGS